MFDESEAIKYIRKTLSPEVAALYNDDDEFLNIIDMVWDYYELNGMLDIDDDEDDPDEATLRSDIVEYVKKTLRKDKGAHVRVEDVEPIVTAILDYEAEDEAQNPF